VRRRDLPPASSRHSTSNVDQVRAQVVQVVGQQDEIPSGAIPFTPRAKKALERALREALSLGHNFIGTEHILLGLVHETDGVVVRILLDFGADGERFRREMIRMLSGPGHRDRPPAHTPPRCPALDETTLAMTVDALLEQIRTAKETAIQTADFARAAEIRTLERQLTMLLNRVTDIIRLG
jgi:ATP-dependent Clp protease ATP-binding subunit ClpA